MKTRIHIWAMIPLLAILSCTMETMEDEVVKEATALGNVNFIAYLDDSASSTRTTLGEKDDNGFYPVYWSENDKIKIMTMDSEPGEGREFTLTEGAGTAQGVFNGSLSQAGDDNIYLAVYPYSTKVSVVDHFSVGITLPQEQRYVPNTFDVNANPALAVTSDGELHFKNVCGLLKLSLTGDVRVKRIKVHRSSDYLWGTILVRIDGYENAYLQGGFPPSEESLSVGTYPSFPSSKEASLDPTSVYLNCDTAVQLTDTPTVFYLVIPTGFLNQGFQLELFDEAGRVVGFRETSEDNAVERSKVREMPILDFRATDLQTGVSQEAYNLSANGTANCYMVHPDVEQYPEGRVYTFYALRKGNGEYPITGGTEARVVFRTRNDQEQVVDEAIIKDVSFDEATGFISFRNTVRTETRIIYCYDDQGNQLFDEDHNPITQEETIQVPEEGNATIALFDENHRILWSWHIWVTEYDPETDNETYPNGTGAIMMDRNLGALSDHGYQAAGFSYQWGRKDPLIRSEVDYTSNPSGIFDMASISGTEKDIIRFAVEHPTTLVNAMQYWVTPSDSPWSRNKTVNDPCPVGWRVPDPETFFFSDLFDKYQGRFNVVEGTSGWNRQFGTAATGYYFPDNVGYWSCYLPNGLTCTGIGVYGGYLERYLSDPLSVRCQREDTGIDEDSYIDLSANGTANCYVINKPGRYKFRADVKGNSEESVGAAYHAYVSWQSSASYTERSPIHYGDYGEPVIYKDGYVYFHTEYQWIQGSVIVSVSDGEDGYGVNRILWNWHLWFTDYDPYSSDACFTVPGNDGEPNRQIMKYNLGAVHDVCGQQSAGVRGMMYQWGRKDPFLGAMNPSGNVPGTGGEYLSVTSSESVGTVNYTIQHPTVIITGESGSFTDWHYSHDNSLWGEEKTKYDPCPPGYKVPSRGSGFLSVTNSNYGFQYNGNFIPSAGYRYYANSILENVGAVASYWSSTPADDGSAYDFYWNGGNEFDVSTHTSYKAQVNHVRCMRE